VTAKLREVIGDLDALRTRPDAWQIPRIEGDLLFHIALASRAQIIVEVGTSYGFSGLHWAAALAITKGHLHTIDKDPKKFHSSRETFTRAGVVDAITNHLGDAREILTKIAGPIDIAFIDADKPDTQMYFDLLWPKMQVGGSVIVDNATTHREQLKDFVAAVRARKDASSVEVAVGNGIEWTIKL
jgi:predicted O-methyltransferase YrrM